MILKIINFNKTIIFTGKRGVRLTMRIGRRIRIGRLLGNLEIRGRRGWIGLLRSLIRRVRLFRR
jgi:hypothetical protein